MAASDIPVAVGTSMTFPLGSGVALYGYSTAGSTAAVAEFVTSWDITV